MTLDEAQLILNVKRGDTLEQAMKVFTSSYIRLSQFNSLPKEL